MELLMHVGTWCTITDCCYQWTKECSKSQAQSVKKLVFSTVSLRSLFDLRAWALFGLVVPAICNLYLHLTSVGIEYSVCHESLLTSFFMLLSWLVERSLVLVICNSTFCVQVHGLPWSHWRIGKSWKGTLSVFYTTYLLNSSYF